MVSIYKKLAVSLWYLKKNENIDNLGHRYDKLPLHK